MGCPEIEPIAGRPEFGNPKHISYVRALEKSDLAPGLRRWAVEITFEGTMECEVWAKSKEEAEEIAKDDFVFTDVHDWESSVYARLAVPAKSEGEL